VDAISECLMIFRSCNPLGSIERKERLDEEAPTREQNPQVPILMTRLFWGWV
jgi:hypothetical protein